MKLKDYRKDFYEYSGKASDLSRQLAFAGIALIWLFKTEVSGVATVPKQLILPGLLIVLTLTLDLLQYVIASLIWRGYYIYLERRRVSEKTNLKKHNTWLERPIWIAFVLKLISIGAAYILLLDFLRGRFLT